MITSDQLFDLLLTSNEVNRAFPSFGQGQVLHLTNEAFAEFMGGGATAADLEAQGLVDAYDITFESDTPETGQPHGLTAIVHLLSSAEAADAFMQRGGVDLGQHMRDTDRGSDVTDSQNLAAPSLGEASTAIQVTRLDPSIGEETVEQSVFWRRGPLIARVTLRAKDTVNRVDMGVRLAQLTDARMAAAVGR